MKTFSLIIIFIAALLFGGYLLATTGLESKPGYSQLKPLNTLEQQSTLSLRLGPFAMSPLHWLSKPFTSLAIDTHDVHADIVLSLLNKLEGLQLHVYDNVQQLSQMQQVVIDQKKALKMDGWETIVTVREDNEQVLIMSKTIDEAIVGLTVSVIDQQQAVFINLMGSINQEDLGNIARVLNADNNHNSNI